MQYNKKSNIIREYRAASSEFIRSKAYLEKKYVQLHPGKQFISLHESQLRDIITANDTFFKCSEALADELLLMQHLYNVGCLNQNLQQDIITDLDEIDQARKLVLKGEATIKEFSERLKAFSNVGK